MASSIPSTAGSSTSAAGGGSGWSVTAVADVHSALGHVRPDECVAGEMCGLGDRIAIGHAAETDSQNALSDRAGCRKCNQLRSGSNTVYMTWRRLTTYMYTHWRLKYHPISGGAPGLFLPLFVLCLRARPRADRAADQLVDHAAGHSRVFRPGSRCSASFGSLLAGRRRH